MIIAVDFDGTITEEDLYPNIGKLRTSFINWLINRKQQGDYIILWTCRTGDKLQEAVEICKQNGLTFDAVNKNLYEDIEPGYSSIRKIIADVYIDDRSRHINEVILKEILTNL